MRNQQFEFDQLRLYNKTPPTQATFQKRMCLSMDRHGKNQKERERERGGEERELNLFLSSEGCRILPDNLGSFQSGDFLRPKSRGLQMVKLCTPKNNPQMSVSR